MGGTDLDHLLAWSLIFFTLLGLLKLVASWSWLNYNLGPQLISLFWLHGVFFNPPENWDLTSRHGFLGFWFQLHTPQLYSAHLNLILGLLVVPVTWSLLTVFNYREGIIPVGSGRLILSLVSWLYAAMIVHHVPDLVMEASLYGTQKLGGDLNVYGEIAVSLLLGLTLAFTSFVLVRPRATNKPKI